MGKKRALEPEGQVDSAGPDLSDLLADKVLDQLDLASLASKLAPDLAERLAQTIHLDALGDLVFQKLASRLANDPIIAEAVAAQLGLMLARS